jgi:DNA-binding NtrC family response regulator
MGMGEVQKTRKILIVDDDEMVREVMRTVLSEPDVIISECANCREAQAELETKTFDIVILDNLMPDGHGVDLIEKACKSAEKVIMVSAHASDHNLTSKAMAKGATAVLEKPFEIWQLKKCIECIPK